MKVKAIITIAILGWISLAMQQGLSTRMSILGAYPDFPLVAIAAVSPFLYRSGGSLFGFVLGVAHGAIAGANLMHYAISRAIAGFAGGWVNDLRIVPTYPAVMITTACLTVLTRLVFMFLAPPSGIGPYLGATIVGAVYNGVLVWPVYALLKRILDPVYR